MQTTDSVPSNIERNPQTNAIEIPKTRISTASQGKAIYDQLVQADVSRSAKRARVRGIVDGNPPYRQSQLKAEGRDYQCNVNWRMAESYFNNAVAAFYDVFSESPTCATVKLKLPGDNDAEYKGRCVTEHFDWLVRGEGGVDYHMSISQNEMVLFGIGPLVFMDEFDWRPTSVLAGSLRVPDRTKSDNSLWELATVEGEFSVVDLYAKIIDEKTATEAGWNVKAVKQAIINAFPKNNSGENSNNWEWYQAQLKTDSLSFSYQSRSVQVGHLFFKEFKKGEESAGKISHKIVLSDSQQQESSGMGDGKPPEMQFLFERENRYDDWNQCVHPMYYDHGGGGYHHSVTGMGVKMYSAVEYQNRLKCNLADKAFTAKIMLQPASEGDEDAVLLQQYGDYAVLKPGATAVQTPITGAMEEGLMFDREVTGLIAANLSQYRMNLQREQGNPITAREVDQRASEQAKLGKTQLSRYYQQMDYLYAEMYRRASQRPVEGAPGFARIKEFQERCKENGVTLAELKKTESVKATRIVGQGSEFLRQQALGELFTAVLPMLPETGRDHMIEDVIASRAGQSGVKRYYPTSQRSQKPDDQLAFAMSQVADMKVGVAPVVTDTQNPVIFAQTFLQAGAQAMQSLEQGADPSEVARFVELVGQATAQHLEKIKNDPSRKAAYDALMEQWKQLAKIHDDLIKHLEQQAQEQGEQVKQRQEAQMRAQAINSGQDGELQLKTAEMRAKLSLAQEKTTAGIQMKREKQAQDLALKDARTAHEIRSKPVNGSE